MRDYWYIIKLVLAKYRQCQWDETYERKLHNIACEGSILNKIQSKAFRMLNNMVEESIEDNHMLARTML